MDQYQFNKHKIHDFFTYNRYALSAIQNNRIMPTANFRITPLSPVIGAEVSGIDLGQPLDAATLAELESAWATHLVLFFREQDLSFDHHKSLGRRVCVLLILPAAP